MSYDAEATAIRSRFNTLWANTTPVAWPNVSFTPPDGEAWVRIGIQPSGADLTTMGGRVWYDGAAMVQVFVPANTGDGEARALAEQVCGIFRNVEADGIIYDTPYTTTGGTNDSGWFQVNVWAPYRRKTDH